MQSGPGAADHGPPAGRAARRRVSAVRNGHGPPGGGVGRLRADRFPGRPGSRDRVAGESDRHPARRRQARGARRAGFTPRQDPGRQPRPARARRGSCSGGRRSTPTWRCGWSRGTGSSPSRSRSRAGRTRVTSMRSSCIFRSRSAMRSNGRGSHRMVARSCARRLERAEGERGDLARLTAIAESWLIEFRPAVEGPVAFRGSRTTPFTAALPVPLAWVEGATAPRGTLIVSGDGGTRPRVVNRGLRELPPRPPSQTEGRRGDRIRVWRPGRHARRVRTTRRSRSWFPPAAARPGPGCGGRPRRHGATHRASRVRMAFDIENRGRDDATLSVPRGMRLDEVLSTASRWRSTTDLRAGGEVRLALPPGRGRMTLLVRGVADRDTAYGVWRVDPLTCGSTCRCSTVGAADAASRTADRGSRHRTRVILRLARTALRCGPRGTARNAAPPLTGGFQRIEVPQHGRAPRRGSRSSAAVRWRRRRSPPA